MEISIRESTAGDLEKIVDYFLLADTDFLNGMGADQSKLPHRDQWLAKLFTELTKPYPQKEVYYITWLVDDLPIGHSNINHIDFGNTATMHLHVWKATKRKSGLGLSLLKETIPYYFRNFQLKTLICEPYSKNIAPNRTLKKLGFELTKSYETIPGAINFKQVVNHYELSHEQVESKISRP